MSKMFKLMMDLRTIRRSELFDPVYYLSTYRDVREADTDPLLHYVRLGWNEGRNPSELFDTNYYLTNNPDVKEWGGNPLVHFIRHGAREGRKPNKAFNIRKYVENHPSIAGSKTNPLRHFLPNLSTNEVNSRKKTIKSLSVSLVKTQIDETTPDVKKSYLEAIALPCTPEVDIVICVGKNPNNIKECIASIEENTDIGNCNIHLLVERRNQENIAQYQS